MKNTIRILASIVLLVLGGAAFAQSPSESAMHRDKVLKEMGLTDSQITQVTNIRDKTLSFARVQRAQIAVVNAQIRLDMTDPSPDLSAVDALVDKKTAFQSELEKRTLSAVAQVHQIVGDENFYKLRGMFLTHAGAMRSGDRDRRIEMSFHKPAYRTETQGPQKQNP